MGNFLLAVNLKSVQKLHTFALPAYCGSIVDVHNIDDIQGFLNHVQDQLYYVIGQGSNTAFVGDFNGQVLRVNLKEIELNETVDSYELKVGSGVGWHDLVKWCLARGIKGFENLALIPGTVGASPIQNIGAYGVEVERFITQVDYVCCQTNMLKSLNHKQCGFAYRDSIFKHELYRKVIITKVHFRLPKAWQPLLHYGELATLIDPTAQDVFDKVVAIRSAKLPDPKVLGNAGSFFKNPVISQAEFLQIKQNWPALPHYPHSKNRVKLPAAWLIDALGFKGQTLGGIRCHPQQALVLTNLGSGRGQELLSLARKIKQAVAAEFGISLENEVQLVGASGVIDL
ncbi:MAG: UDP-N-acetylmuramate dehydrogenase [Paraglaciecola sp.]